jgi:hypothetical protein
MPAVGAAPLQPNGWLRKTCFWRLKTSD